MLNSTYPRKAYMLSRLLAFAALAGMLLTAACSGSGGQSLTPNLVTKPPVTTQADAKSSITFTIPLGNSSLRAPLSQDARHANASARKPLFIDGNSDGGMSVYFDSVAIVPNVDFSAQKGALGTGPSGGGTLANGGSFTYSSQIVKEGTTNQLAAVVTVDYTTIPGPHTIGAVQTNGACTGSDPCLKNNPGYVLAEGQDIFTLAPGTNPATALYLKGVAQSAFICDAGCTGGLGTPLADGSYNLDVVVADENGTAIPHQVDNGKPVQYDNGPYDIVTVDPTVATVTDAATKALLGDFAAPGTHRHSQDSMNPNGNGTYGETVNVKCIKVGSTTIEAKLTATSAIGSISGFTPTPGTNYPMAGSVLGSTGADNYFGGAMAINCSASGALTIQ
jgi:hypothetical protein